MDGGPGSEKRALWGHFRQVPLVIPGHPPTGVGGKLGAVSQKSGQVLKSVDFHEIAGVDEAHKEVAHPGASFGPVK